MTRASAVLRIAQPTISEQVRLLEDRLGQKLFTREGRGLVLTETGQVVHRYADEIFGLGRELLDAVKGRETGRPVRVTVGVADVVPKLVAHRLLAPVLNQSAAVHLVVQEDRPERLLAALAVHELDVVISDSPLPPGSRVRAFNHLLGESGLSVFGTEALARLHGTDFPRSLDGAPFLLPTEHSALRRTLMQFFEAAGVRPRIVGEFEDSALLKIFGEHGAGLFASPIAVDEDVKRRYGVVRLGSVDGVRERFWIISGERRLKHPAVMAISQAARGDLFRVDSDA